MTSSDRLSAPHRTGPPATSDSSPYSSFGRVSPEHHLPGQLTDNQVGGNVNGPRVEGLFSSGPARGVYAGGFNVRGGDSSSPFWNGCHDGQTQSHYSSPAQNVGRHGGKSRGSGRSSPRQSSRGHAVGGTIFGGGLPTHGHGDRRSNEDHKHDTNGSDDTEAIDGNQNGRERAAAGSTGSGRAHGGTNGDYRPASGSGMPPMYNFNTGSPPSSNASEDGHQPSPTPEAPPSPPRPSIYPNFRDGDVIIVSPTGKVWKLHSIILSKASPKLNEIFKNTPAIHVTKRMMQEGNAVKWKIELGPEPRAQELDPQGLRFMSFNRVNVKSKYSVFKNNYNGIGDRVEFNKLYDNFFRCVYNMDPRFNIDDDKLAHALIIDATMLLQAATYLDAIPCVRLIVEANLLRLHQALWQHISDKPEGWIHIAARLQSPLIFRECVIHIVGKFHLKGRINEQFLQNGEHGPIAENIWTLIVKKAKELKDKKIRIERLLLEFYPTRMIHREDKENVPGRAVYGADIYLWQAIVIFRQFISSAYMSNFHHKASDAGLSFYRTIGAADATYLRADTLEKFHENFGMSPKGRQCLAAAVEQIKTEVKPIVSELLRDRSQLIRLASDPLLNHLTCTEILEEEMPWYVKPDPETQNGDMDMGMGF